jgi:signal transduction histidine kinase
LWVRVQVILLGELVNVLLDNACKYSPAARPITVLLGGDQQGVELSVRDEGPGIGEEDLTQLFRPFFRSTAIRLSGVEGLGLGLAVATRLAEALGGTLTVRSSPGQGSCFTLRLPRAGKDTAIIESANL